MHTHRIDAKIRKATWAFTSTTFPLKQQEDFDKDNFLAKDNIPHDYTQIIAITCLPPDAMAS